MTKKQSALKASILGGEKSHASRLGRVSEYEKNPILCLQCQKPLLYDAKIAGNRFCNRSCSASYNNLGVRHNPRTRSEKPCLVCLRPTLSKFCSQECSARHQRQKVFDAIENGKYTIGNKRTIRNYLIEKRGCKCEICGLSIWREVPVPLDGHHKDGNYQNNLPSNLQLLCLNCHGITPNYRGKNKGSGRFSRRQRYRSGKSY